jgi:hypothetical protein
MLLSVDRSSEEHLLGAHGQEPELIAWAESNGFEVVGFAFENGVSGATPILLRDEFVDAIRQARDDPRYAGILVPSTERLARDKGAFDELLYAMSWAGKHLFVGIRDERGRLIEVRDVAGPESIVERHERQLRELRAIEARSALSAEGVRARRAKMNRLGYGGGKQQPVWFMDRIELGGGSAEFAPNRQRLQWALWMRDRRHDGWSFARIASALNEHGITTASGCPWRAGGVHRVLSEQLARVPPELLSVWTLPAGPVGRDASREAVAV